MTKQDKIKIGLGIPAALLSFSGVMFWLLSAAFVPQRTFDDDQLRQDTAIRSLQTDRASSELRFDKLERIGCEPLSEAERYKLGCPK